MIDTSPFCGQHCSSSHVARMSHRFRGAEPTVSSDSWAPASFPPLCLPSLSLSVDQLQAVAVGAATHAASLSEGSQKLNSLETLEPMKKAMMQALARRRLLDDQACSTPPTALWLRFTSTSHLWPCLFRFYKGGPRHVPLMPQAESPPLRSSFGCVTI